MPYQTSEPGNGSLVVPVLLAVFVVAIAVVIVRQQYATQRLTKTDRIACRFLTTDANTRVKQASNAEKTGHANQAFVTEIDKLATAFRKAAAKKPGSADLLLRYLAAQRRVSETTREQTEKNVALTRELAAEGHALAAQLKC